MPVCAGPTAGRSGFAAVTDPAEARRQRVAGSDRRRGRAGEERARRHDQAGDQQGAKRCLDEPGQDAEAAAAGSGGALAGTLFR